MALLKRKPEGSKVLSVRIPESAHKEFDELQVLADAKGFDLRGSLTDAVLQWLRQARKELEVSEVHGNGLVYDRESNGAGRQRGNEGLAR
jgi:hypothetical protein